MPDPADIELEGQDQAEVFDEENITEDGYDIATPDLQRDVFDVTSADEDVTEALTPQDDFDPDAADGAELEEIVMAEEDLDEPRSFARDDANLVADDDLSPADMESEDRFAEAAATVEEADDAAALLSAAAVDSALDRALEGTFPASDPVSINSRYR